VALVTGNPRARGGDHQGVGAAGAVGRGELRLRLRGAEKRGSRRS